VRNPNEIDQLISAVEAELARLNARKAELLTHIVDLRREKAAFLPVQ
jgi:prefoldin subunit 5